MSQFAEFACTFVVKELKENLSETYKLHKRSMKYGAMFFVSSTI